MNREALFESWVPPAGVWSLWARPILFAQMPETGSAPGGADSWQTFDVSRAPGVGEQTVLVVDLPGAESVWLGLALARRGYRPVPLYNACTGPHEVIDQRAIIEALRAGAEQLAGLALTDAAPAFLLDSRRMMGPPRLNPGDFDNRWKVFPEDFPSAAFLSSRGFRRAMLIQRGSREPREDLAHVLRRWQDAGLSIEAKDVADGAPPQPITVKRPPWYRRAWLRVLELFGLGRGSPGGFGHVVPQPSHG